MTQLKYLIDELDSIIEDPDSGLPEEVFLLASRITAMVNVDLLIRNDSNETLLTWRGGSYYSPGWHIPGGIVRYKESMYERIKQVAKLELGTEVDFRLTPILVNEIIRSPERVNRGHFISFLFDCQLISEPIQQPQHGEWKWHEECPSDLIPVHMMYKEVINGKTPEKECVSDFGISRIILNNISDRV